MPIFFNKVCCFSSQLTDKDIDGETALHKAARAGQREVISVLLTEAPELLNVVDKHYRTAFSVAKDEMTAALLKI